MKRSRDRRLNSILGRAIKQRRNCLRFTQHELAKMVRVCRNTIAKLEAGKQMPPVLTILNIAHELSIDLDDINKIWNHES